MKVKELIAELQNLDPEAMVVVSGYEGGVEEVEFVEEHQVALNVNKCSYYGDHELVFENSSFIPDKYEVVKGVRLS